MLVLFVAVQAAFTRRAALVRAAATDRERGQTTAEYALVLLGAAAVALLLVAWAAKSGKVTALLDGVLDKILSEL